MPQTETGIGDFWGYSFKQGTHSGTLLGFKLFGFGPCELYTKGLVCTSKS